MLDIKFIRENPELVKTAAKNKAVDVDVARLLEVDKRRRELMTEEETLRSEQKKRSRQPSSEDLDDLKALKERIKVLSGELTVVEAEFENLMLEVPNLPTEDTPIGLSLDENVVAKTVGKPTGFDFIPQSHSQIAETLDLIDKERAAKVAGSRFAYIKGDLVRLQMALMQFVVDTLTDSKILKKIIDSNGLEVSDRPFVPILPPALIKTDVYRATARLNSEEVTYKLEGDELWLNASAEHSLCPMYQGEVLNEAELPIRYLGYTTAFRREAGTYGKDTDGILRMHQFDKMELESFSVKENSLSEHLFFVAIQEYLMAELGIPYRVILKCTADIGMANARGVDIESWLPGQRTYRETHTADYMTDYQSRRLNTRVRRGNGELEFVHTNDATALAMGRTLIAIIENYQTRDGGIAVPPALQPYLRGQKVID